MIRKDNFVQTHKAPAFSAHSRPQTDFLSQIFKFKKWSKNPRAHAWPGPTNVTNFQASDWITCAVERRGQASLPGRCVAGRTLVKRPGAGWQAGEGRGGCTQKAIIASVFEHRQRQDKEYLSQAWQRWRQSTHWTTHLTHVAISRQQELNFVTFKNWLERRKTWYNWELIINLGPTYYKN